MRPIRPQTVTLAVLAILFGLCAAWLAKQVLRARQPAVVQVIPPEPKFSTVVLQTNMAADARIRDQDVAQSQDTLEGLKRRKVPLDRVFQFKQQAVGRILKRARPAASWLTEDDFYPIGVAPHLKLREGYRAVNLRVDDPAISPSIIQTGSLVDVIFTATNPDDSSKLTRLLATGLEVLSPPVSDGGLPNAVTTIAPATASAAAAGKKSYIVVAATPEQAAQLALAQQLEGTISVSLCAAQGSDADKGSANRVDLVPGPSDYRITERELLRLPPRVKPIPPERYVVEQISGNKISYVVFTGDNERLSQAETRQNSLPAGAASAGTPPKRCKKCEEAAKKAREKANREGGGLSPVPETPNPTPAPRTT